MRKLIKLNVLLIVCVLLIVTNTHAQTALSNAFAHNDYKHKRPLFDALDQGVANIEADIFLYKNKLVVAHVVPYFRGGRTLEELYFKPLMDRYTANNCIYPGYNEPVVLMIDVKSDANKTYTKLKALLNKYQAILTSYDNGVITNRAITVVLSGNKPYEMMSNETTRLAFIDDDLRKTFSTNYTNQLCLMSSAKFSHVTSWSGKQPMTSEEKTSLCAYIEKAHLEGKKVRLWAIPQNRAAWTALMNCGVDLINSDDLEGMNSYFTHKQLISGYSYQKVK